MYIKFLFNIYRFVSFLREVVKNTEKLGVIMIFHEIGRIDILNEWKVLIDRSLFGLFSFLSFFE